MITWLWRFFIHEILYCWKKRFYVKIYLKGGGVIKGWFTEFSWEGKDGKIIKLSWKSWGHQLGMINIDEIVAIHTTSRRGIF